MASPSDLVRIVAGPHGGLAIGRTLAGRGAWLCAGSAACVEAAARRKAFSRALRAEIRPDAVDALRSTVADRARMEESESSRSQDRVTRQPGSPSGPGTASAPSGVPG